MRILKNIYGIFLIILLGLLSACGDSTESNTISIDFLFASPNSITLKGTGGSGRSELSTVSFLVRDPNGVILADQPVKFTLSTTVGGITLLPASAVTNTAGVVSTVVQSGNIPTSVRVIASISGTDISTSSDLLSITSGLPDQDSFSPSSNLYNPEGWNYDGEESVITIRLGDTFNNPVPEGTSISFTTEGGIIQGSCLTNDTSACSVTWRSQEPRPSDGRVTILATALGQESFNDRNGNGLFDAGDTFTDLPEAFRDDNENGIYDLGEFFVDLNSNGLYSAADGRYNGLACMPGYALCSSQKNAHISANIVLVMSTSFGTITTVPANSVNVASQATVNINVIISDSNGNSMPGNSSIEVIATNGTVINSDILPSVIPTNRTGPYSFNIILQGDDTSSVGTLTIKVVTPKNNLTPTILTVND